MANITVTPKKVSALPGSRTVPLNAGGSGNLGDTGYIAADGDVEQGDGSGAGTAYLKGIITSISGGKLTFVAGDRIGLTVDGPVAGFSGMTPNDTLYQSDDAGRLADAAGTVSVVAGWAQSAEIFVVRPALPA